MLIGYLTIAIDKAIQRVYASIIGSEYSYLNTGKEAEMYAIRNFKTKKELKEVVARGEEVRIYQPGGIFKPPEASPHYTGTAYLEGAHYPAPHTWYAIVKLRDGLIVKVG